MRRAPVEKTSELVKNIIRANETQRVKSYIEAGCINSDDGMQNMNKCRCNCFLSLDSWLDDLGPLRPISPLLSTKLYDFRNLYRVLF